MRSGAASDIDRLGFVGAIVKAFIKGDLPGVALLDSKPLREKQMMVENSLAFSNGSVFAGFVFDMNIISCWLRGCRDGRTHSFFQLTSKQIFGFKGNEPNYIKKTMILDLQLL